MFVVIGNHVEAAICLNLAHFVTLWYACVVGQIPVNSERGNGWINCGVIGVKLLQENVIERQRQVVENVQLSLLMNSCSCDTHHVTSFVLKSNGFKITDLIFIYVQIYFLCTDDRFLIKVVQICIKCDYLIKYHIFFSTIIPLGDNLATIWPRMASLCRDIGNMCYSSSCRKGFIVVYEGSLLQCKCHLKASLLTFFSPLPFFLFLAELGELKCTKL